MKKCTGPESSDNNDDMYRKLVADSPLYIPKYVDFGLGATSG